MIDDVQVTGQTVIQLDSVAYAYPYDEFAVIKGVSCNFGEKVNTVLCDTQSGKTTLCRLITGELKPSDGKIFLDGMPIGSITAAQRGILYLSDKPTFFENATVAQNIAYPLRVRKVDKAQMARIVEAIAEQLGLTAVLQSKIKHCTPYQRQMVALARGLTLKRRVVLFDDFFAANATGTPKGVVSGACDDADGKRDGLCPQILGADDVLALFPDALKIIVTSDKRLLTGNTVILDGGISVFCGNEQQSREYANGLDFLFDRL